MKFFKKYIAINNKYLLSTALFIGGVLFANVNAQTNNQEWKGKIEKSTQQSIPYKIDYLKKAPEGAPNVVLILLDDVGFGASSAFGGLVNTPTFDSLANNGL